MKPATILLLLYYSITIHQHRAGASIIPTITGTITGAVELTKSLFGLHTGYPIITGGRINEVDNRNPKGIRQRIKNTLKTIQDQTRGTGIIELEMRREDSIQEWADRANKRLSNSSKEAQLQGKELIEDFSNQYSQNLKNCSDKVMREVKRLQAAANPTGKRLNGPINKIAEQVASCSELMAYEEWGFADCIAKISKDLDLLSSIPGQLAYVRTQIYKIAIQRMQKHICVSATLSNFRKDARLINMKINELLAEDKKKAEENPSSEKPASEEPTSEKPSSEEPASEEPATEKPASDEPASEEPASEKSTSEEPATDEPATDEPASDEPASEKPASDESESE